MELLNVFSDTSFPCDVVVRVNFSLSAEAKRNVNSDFNSYDHSVTDRSK